MNNFNFLKRRKYGACRSLKSCQILNTLNVEFPHDTLIIAEIINSFSGYSTQTKTHELVITLQHNAVHTWKFTSFKCTPLLL